MTPPPDTVPARSGAIRKRLGEILGLDLRSLAAFRVALAGVALLDLSTRAADLRAHYSDAGIASRKDTLEEFAFLHDHAISLHLIGGSSAVQALLFTGAAIAALALLAGFRTRLATVALWLLTSSLQLRNLYVGAGSDALLRMLLLWGCFLPLGARASVDARRAGDVDVSRPYVSLASFGLIVQLACVFFFAGYGKWQVPAWPGGTALGDILADEMRVTAVGASLRSYPGLLAWLSWAMPWLEMTVPLFFFSPLLFGPLRTLAAFGLGAMALAFGVVLHVGLFPAVTLAGALALLPGWFWESPWRSLRLLAGRSANEPPARGLSPQPCLLSELACAPLLGFVILWNATALVPGLVVPRPLEALGQALFLQQAWAMFAQPAARTGWLVMPGRLGDGRVVDLLAAGGRVPDLAAALRPVEWARPPATSSPYANDRWLNFLDRAVRGSDTARRLNSYGRFFCREWNSRHSGGDQLASFELWWVATDIEPGPRLGPTIRRLIWNHDCFG